MKLSLKFPLVFAASLLALFFAALFGIYMDKNLAMYSGQSAVPGVLASFTRLLGSRGCAGALPSY
jgi:hypothetical protein